MTVGTDRLCRDMRIECRAERWPVKVSVDAAELLAGLDHPGGAPAQRSKVMGDVPSDVRLCRPVPAWDWKNLPRDHSRGVLLHDQWISKHYRSRHNLPVPTDVPRRLRGLRRVQRLGARTSNRG